MTALVLPKLKIVSLECVDLHGTPALEIYRQHLRDVADYRMRSYRGKIFKESLDRILLMASGKSAYLSEKVKNEVLGAVAYTAAATTYTALLTSAAATDLDALDGSTISEVSGGSYARVSLTNNATNYGTITGDNPKVNSTAHTFTTATANWNSGSNIAQMCIMDGAGSTTSDHLLIWGDLTTAKPVLNGDTAQFNVSAISWTEE